MKHLLKLSDWSEKEIIETLNLADQLKFEKKNGIEHHLLKGKTLGMIFQKSSTRTRVSFEVGMYDLGGSALFLSSRDLQIGRGEPVEDTARVLSRYLDGIMIRTYAQSEVEALATMGSIPIINGLTDYCHPCQVLADLMTIREHKGVLKGLKLVYIGDGNNMANSLIVGGIKMGMKVAVACPEGYTPDGEIMKWAHENGDFTWTTSVLEAAKDADVLYTDVWASMGQESEAEARKKIFSGYQINSDVMAVAAHDAMVLHCLPAHRGEEITADVLEAHAGEIFDEAENRLHAQKAVLVKCLK
ncbi:MAG: ornithine carbamoyltransferase [Eubacteriales bacterium]